MSDSEKLGVFYLGRTGRPGNKPGGRDLGSRTPGFDRPCVGMKGSGKTGLCIGLLEEAVIDEIPALVIDPQGRPHQLTAHLCEVAPRGLRFLGAGRRGEVPASPRRNR
jgi:hypothetical protein